MGYYANLHLHSTHSDGKYSPRELAKMAKEEGYKAVSLTDHDTATGTKEFKEACEEFGLECITGIELTAPSDFLMRPNGKRGSFHMTAFHFDPEYPAMKEYLEGMALRETDQTEKLTKRALEEGLLTGITWEEVREFNKGIEWLCNEHVFRLLEHKGLKTKLDYPEYFNTVFGARRSTIPPAYNFKELQELIDLVHDAGGIILVAHPHNQLHLIDELLKMGIDGMEVWHPDLTEEEKVEAYKIALEKGIYISGGSDHSGLCGGEYENYSDPKESHFYLEPASVGTTKEHFDEIKNRKINR